MRLPIILAITLGTAVFLLSRRSSAQAATFAKVSFYGRGFDGKQTANGEIFDQNALTCAARAPVKFGTRFRVTNPVNGLSVVVRCNDRGPFTKNASGEFDRLLDLSQGAAERLDMIERGVILAQIETLS